MSETKFTLRDPDGNEHVVGNSSDRARLLSAGYVEVGDGETPAEHGELPDVVGPSQPTDQGDVRPAETPKTVSKAPKAQAPPAPREGD